MCVWPAHIPLKLSRFTNDSTLKGIHSKMSKNNQFTFFNKSYDHSIYLPMLGCSFVYECVFFFFFLHTGHSLHEPILLYYYITIRLALMISWQQRRPSEGRRPHLSWPPQRDLCPCWTLVHPSVRSYSCQVDTGLNAWPYPSHPASMVWINARYTQDIRTFFPFSFLFFFIVVVFFPFHFLLFIISHFLIIWWTHFCSAVSVASKDSSTLGYLFICIKTNKQGLLIFI